MSCHFASIIKSVPYKNNNNKCSGQLRAPPRLCAYFILYFLRIRSTGVLERRLRKIRLLRSRCRKYADRVGIRGCSGPCPSRDQSGSLVAYPCPCCLRKRLVALEVSLLILVSKQDLRRQCMSLLCFGLLGVGLEPPEAAPVFADSSMDLRFILVDW
jgi:hypothetical protein